DYNGPMHVIKTTYDDNLLYITPEHPISSKIVKRKTIYTDKKTTIKEVSDLDFREPMFLKKGDKIQFPNIEYNGTINDIEFMYALGLYFAEGSISDKYHVQYSLHKKEMNLVDKLNKYFHNTPYIYNSKYDKSMRVTYGNKDEVTKFNNFIFGKSINKTFNWDILNYDNDSIISFLNGIFDGDGCRRIRKYGNKNSVEYTLGLATMDGIYQIRLLLRLIGINSSITSIDELKSKIYDNKLKCYREIQSGPVYRIDIYGIFAHKLDTLFGYNDISNTFKSPSSDFNDFSTINSNNVIDYNGVVYNLEVDEDNSYTVSDKVVHNCWGIDASSVFSAANLVESLVKNPYFRYKAYKGNSFDTLYTQLNLPIIVPKYDFYIIGGDMGYTSNSPSHIIVMGAYDRKNKEGEDIQHYDIVYRLEIENMASFNMAKTINYLIEYFNCKHVCIDAQTLGHQIYDHLIDREIFPMTYRQNKMYTYPAIFTRPLIVGTIDTIDQTTGKKVEEEVIYSEKVASTNKLIQLVNDGRFHVAHEDSGNDDFDDLITVMMAETQTPCQRRHSPFTYTNSVNDHAVDALRCCALVILQIIEKGYMRHVNTASAKPSRLAKSVFKPKSRIKRRERFYG
ncbi:MAG: LAGLIDADG family homing endonuclease, partial [Candidatus Pacebacteria bacterium]|nr:LAGLIDADG family homing endonuclease [Candidatus Paceibacterota bacterium]